MDELQIHHLNGCPVIEASPIEEENEDQFHDARERLQDPPPLPPINSMSHDTDHEQAPNTKEMSLTTTHVIDVDQLEPEKHAPVSPSLSASSSSVSRLDTAEEAQHSIAKIVIQDYALNKTLALQKKKKACNYDLYKIQEKTGCTVVLFNTTSFEVLKNFILKQLNISGKYTLEHTPHVDTNKFITQDVFRVLDPNNSNHIYTLNLYRTTSNMMVNGPKNSIFMREDFPTISKQIEMMKTSILLNNISLKNQISMTQKQSYNVQHSGRAGKTRSYVSPRKTHITRRRSSRHPQLLTSSLGKHCVKPVPQNLHLPNVIKETEPISLEEATEEAIESTPPNNNIENIMENLEAEPTITESDLETTVDEEELEEITQEESPTLDQLGICDTKQITAQPTAITTETTENTCSFCIQTFETAEDLSAHALECGTVQIDDQPTLAEAESKHPRQEDEISKELPKRPTRTKNKPPKLKDSATIGIEVPQKKIITPTTNDDTQENTIETTTEGKKSVTLYCTCQTEWQHEVKYIGCDFCNDWFHYQCIGMPEQIAGIIEEYRCPECCKKDTKTKKDGHNRKNLAEEENRNLKAEVKSLKNQAKSDKDDYQKLEKEIKNLNHQLEKKQTNLDSLSTQHSKTKKDLAAQVKKAESSQHQVNQLELKIADLEKKNKDQENDITSYKEFVSKEIDSEAIKAEMSLKEEQNEQLRQQSIERDNRIHALEAQLKTMSSTKTNSLTQEISKLKIQVDALESEALSARNEKQELQAKYDVAEANYLPEKDIITFLIRKELINDPIHQSPELSTTKETTLPPLSRAPSSHSDHDNTVANHTSANGNKSPNNAATTRHRTPTYPRPNAPIINRGATRDGNNQRDFCVFEYFGTEQCPFTRCMFQHTITEAQRNDTQIQERMLSKQQRVQQKRQNFLTKTAKGVCYYYILGRCRKDRTCTFSHQVPPNIKNDPTTIRQAEEFMERNNRKHPMARPTYNNTSYNQINQQYSKQTHRHPDQHKT